jgi:hypothetical protein
MKTSRSVPRRAQAINELKIKELLQTSRCVSLTTPDWAFAAAE